jgi:hypothetical protein
MKFCGYFAASICCWFGTQMHGFLMQLGGRFEMQFTGRFKCKQVAGLLCKSVAYLMQIHNFHHLPFKY